MGFEQPPQQAKCFFTTDPRQHPHGGGDGFFFLSHL
jgi:hypothetical protein